MPKRLRDAILLALITAVLLEVTLQLLYLGVWLCTPNEVQAVAAGDRVILCIGDSFTYGMGASSPAKAYPGQLECMLRERAGPRWRVVNHGVPGRNSRELLERIDGWLERYHPEFVCVVVGVNDGWTHADEYVLPPLDRSEVKAAEGSEPFEWRWRTLRLFQGLGQWNPFRGGEPAAPAPAEPELRAQAVEAEEAAAPGAGEDLLVGSWVIEENGTVLTLGADGKGSTAGQSFQWSAACDHLTLVTDRGAAHRATWSCRGDCRHVRFEDNGQEMTLLPQRGTGPASVAVPQDTLAAARHDYTAGEVPAALDRFRRLADAAPPESMEELRARNGIVVCLASSRNEPEHLAAELQWIRQFHAANPSAECAVLLAQALDSCGFELESYELAKASLEEYPTNGQLWHNVARHANQADDRELAVRAIDNALKYSAEPSPWIWRTRVNIYADADPYECARSILCAYQLDSNERLTELKMFQYGPRFSEDDLVKAVRELGLTAQERDFALASHQRAVHRDRSNIQGVLASHLRQIVQRDRAYGAQTLLGSYPFKGGSVYDTGRLVARETSVPWVELHERFMAMQRSEPDRELFVADGHCNDDGYRLMAEGFAEEIIRQTRGR